MKIGEPVTLIKRSFFFSLLKGVRGITVLFFVDKRIRTSVTDTDLFMISREIPKDKFRALFRFVSGDAFGAGFEGMSADTDPTSTSFR
jgi:hypothetical protein